MNKVVRDDNIPAIRQGDLWRCPTCNRCLKKNENFCSRCGTKINRVYEEVRKCSTSS